MNNNSKICKVCNIQKSLQDFNKSKNKDGLRSLCKQCQSEQYKLWYSNNSQKQCDKSRSWRKANPEKVAAQKKRNYKRNPEAQHKRNKKWKTANPLKIKEQDLRRRASLQNNGIYLVTAKELEKILSSCCLYCGTKEKITVDHVVPVSRGGTHSIGNLVSACLSCNTSKGAKTITEWRSLK